MRKIIIEDDTSNVMEYKSYFGTIIDPSFIGGHITFVCDGHPKCGWDFFFENERNAMGFSLNSLPNNLKEYLMGIKFKGF